MIFIWNQLILELSDWNEREIKTKQKIITIVIKRMSTEINVIWAKIWMLIIIQPKTKHKMKTTTKKYRFNEND